MKARKLEDSQSTVSACTTVCAFPFSVNEPFTAGKECEESFPVLIFPLS